MLNLFSVPLASALCSSLLSEIKTEGATASQTLLAIMVER